MASNFKAQPREVKWVLSELNPQNKSAGNQVNPRLQHTTTTTQKVSAPISSELLRPLTSPLPSQESLSSGHYGVSRQHLEGGRLSGSVHTEEAETLRTHILKSPFTGLFLWRWWFGFRGWTETWDCRSSSPLREESRHTVDPPPASPSS